MKENQSLELNLGWEGLPCVYVEKETDHEWTLVSVRCDFDAWLKNNNIVEEWMDQISVYIKTAMLKHSGIARTRQVTKNEND